ncbi:MAG TPA: phage holin family protein [Solirubrobacteraceae bacterium]
MAPEDPQLAQSFARTITEVSERASLLVREEIELAKAEIVEKATKIAKGAVVGLVAGVFALVAVFFVLEGLAWLISIELFPSGDYFWGFFVVAFLLLVLGVAGGYFAFKAISGGPPTPKMAIGEARKIRDAVKAKKP